MLAAAEIKTLNQKGIKVKVGAKTDCGYEFQGMVVSCAACNPLGAHYHYSDGSCDGEPCYRHGGPA